MIFPAVNDPNPARKSPKFNPSVDGIVGMIEVQAYRSVFELKDQ